MKRKSFNTRLYLMYLLALAPLIIFGAYKNGFELYQKGLVGPIEMLRPFIILAAGLLGSVSGGLLREWTKDDKWSKSMIDKIKGDVVEAALVVAILPLDTNTLVLLGTTFIFSFFFPKLSLNKVALMYIIVEGVNVLLGLNNFHNAYQMSTVLNYDGYDLFFGNGVGGIFSTNVFLIILAFIFLCFNKLYKKETVVAALITFLVLVIVPNMLMNQYEEIIPLVCGYNILFIIIFIAPNLYSSSYTVKGQITSGILIGILTYAFSFWTPYTSAILAVLVASLLKGILDRIFVIK